MSDEFDDDSISGLSHGQAARGTGRVDMPAPLGPRLVARLYVSADHAMRARLLACLVRPLGLLGLFGVCAGAFGSLLASGRNSGDSPNFAEVTRFTSGQILELARFVEQVNPETLQQVASTLSDSGFGSTTFAAAAVALLARHLSRPSS